MDKAHLEALLHELIEVTREYQHVMQFSGFGVADKEVLPKLESKKDEIMNAIFGEVEHG